MPATPTIRHFVGGSIAKITSSTMVYTCTKFHALMKKCTIACFFLARICPTIPKGFFSTELCLEARMILALTYEVFLAFHFVMRTLHAAASMTY